jgi:hypothetical protein
MQANRRRATPVSWAVPAFGLAIACAGWVALIASAVLAMGSAPDRPTALALAVAGSTAVVGVASGLTALLTGRRAAVQITGLMAIGVGLPLGFIAFAWAVLFHW